jgi:hypothetical protein
MVERFNIIFLWLLTKEFHIPKLWDKRSTKKKNKNKNKGCRLPDCRGCFDSHGTGITMGLKNVSGHRHHLLNWEHTVPLKELQERTLNQGFGMEC